VVILVVVAVDVVVIAGLVVWAAVEGTGVVAFPMVKVVPATVVLRGDQTHLVVPVADFPFVTAKLFLGDQDVMNFLTVVDVFFDDCVVFVVPLLRISCSGVQILFVEAWEVVGADVLVVVASVVVG